MPTAKDMDDKYMAEFQLFGGSPSRHEDRLRSDPAYLAADQAKSRGSLYPHFNLTKAVRDSGGHIDGEISYDPKTGKMGIKFFQR